MEQPPPEGTGESKEPVALPDTPELPGPPILVARVPRPQAPKPASDSDQYRQMGLAYTVPAALVAPVIVLTWIGVWLDGRLGAGASGFTIAGALLGIVVGVINMIRLATKLGK